jgi:hypothetical protein
MSMGTPAGFPGAMQPANVEQAMRVLTGRPYFSYVRFSAARSGTSPAFTYTILQGQQVTAFAYKIGDLMTIAGRPADIATKADTNLYAASETIDSEQVFVEGVQLQLGSGAGQSDPFAALVACRDIAVSVAFNGSQRVWDLGNAEMIPGGSGFYAPSAAASTSTGGSTGSATWGIPAYENYFPIVGGIQWQPKGQQDSSLVVTLTATRVISWAVSNANAPAVATFDLRVQFVSTQDANRSANQ